MVCLQNIPSVLSQLWCANPCLLNKSLQKQKIYRIWAVTYPFQWIKFMHSEECFWIQLVIPQWVQTTRTNCSTVVTSISGNKSLQNRIKVYRSYKNVTCKSQKSSAMFPQYIRSLHVALWLCIMVFRLFANSILFYIPE